MNRMLFWPAAMAAALAACATTPPRPAPALPGKDACIYISSINGWEVLDDQNLVVRAPLQKDTYLVHLFQPALNLPFRESLGFEDGDHNSQLCGTGDSLRVGGPMPQNVGISAVRRVSADDITAYKAALAAAKQAK